MTATLRFFANFKHSEKVLLQSPLVNIVSHIWLEECLIKKERLCIRPYLFSKGCDAFVPNGSEGTIKGSMNSICFEDCVTSNSNCQPLKGKQSLEVTEFELSCEDEKKRPCRTLGSTHQPVKKKQRSSVAEADLECDMQRKRPNKSYLMSPKCSLWGRESSKVGKSKSPQFADTVEEDDVERDSCCNKSIDIAMAMQEDASANVDMLNGGSCVSDELTMSKVIWESECLQDIAQVYVGSFGDESTTLPATKYLLNRAFESQESSITLVQDQAQPKESAYPICIPRRRFTSKGFLGAH